MLDLDELHPHQFHDAVPDSTHLFPQNFINHDQIQETQPNDLVTNKYTETVT